MDSLNVGQSVGLQKEFGPKSKPVGGPGEKAKL